MNKLQNPYLEWAIPTTFRGWILGMVVSQNRKINLNLNSHPRLALMLGFPL